MRAFIAIDLPENIRAALSQKQTDFRAALGPTNPDKPNRDSDIRWTRPAGIHLTLKFLGEITDTQLMQVTEALSGIQPFAGFPVDVKGFGFFPSAARPRILWAGVEAPPDLRRLAEEIEDAMEQLKFAREHRDFNPHLTLARIKVPRPRPALRALVEQKAEVVMGRFAASEFFLFESKLSPHGAEYRKVLCFPDRSKRLPGLASA
jgi:2'-5' RNA ligase